MNENSKPTNSSSIRVLLFTIVGMTALAVLMSVMTPKLKGTPYSGLRWLGDTPQVQLEDQWYGLESVNSLKVENIIDYCKQVHGSGWRKRFSEDLGQALRQLRPFRWGSGADLALRGLETKELVILRDVAFDEDQRNQIWRDRYEWPWRSSFTLPDGEIQTDYYGEPWNLISIDGIPAKQLLDAKEEAFDTYCELAGKSPGKRIDIVLREPTSGELKTLEGVERKERWH